MIFETVCLYQLSFGKIPRPTEKPESSLVPLFSVKGDLGAYSVTDYAEHAEKSENKKSMTSILEWETYYFLVIHLALSYKLDFSGLMFLQMF